MALPVIDEGELRDQRLSLAEMKRSMETGQPGAERAITWLMSPRAMLSTTRAWTICIGTLAWRRGLELFKTISA